MICDRCGKELEEALDFSAIKADIVGQAYAMLSEIHDPEKYITMAKLISDMMATF